MFSNQLLAQWRLNFVHVTSRKKPFVYAKFQHFSYVASYQTAMQSLFFIFYTTLSYLVKSHTWWTKEVYDLCVEGKKVQGVNGNDLLTTEARHGGFPWPFDRAPKLTIVDSTYHVKYFKSVRQITGTNLAGFQIMCQWSVAAAAPSNTVVHQLHPAFSVYAFALPHAIWLYHNTKKNNLATRGCKKGGWSVNNRRISIFPVVWASIDSCLDDFLPW